MELARVLGVVLAIAACGSNKRGDAPTSGASGSSVASGSSLVTGSGAGSNLADGSADLPVPQTGDLQVRVEWRDVPVPMRAAPGRTPCNTARAPAVAPTTTWGIPDVLVVVAGTTAAMTPELAPAEVRVVVADCVLAPRIATGAVARVESATGRPTALTLTRRGDVAALATLAAPTDARTIQLPIAGHAVRLALDAGGLYELATDGVTPETAWLVTAPNAGVTEPNGQLLVKDLVPGTYTVTAWLPPRAGASAQLVRGSVAVAAGDLAELTLELK